MVVVTGKHIEKVSAKFPDAARELAQWGKVVRAARWQNMIQLRATYPDADQVRGYVIFNIRRNLYRLITVIHFAKAKDGKSTQGHIYIRSFLTHRQYDNPDNRDKDYGS